MAKAVEEGRRAIEIYPENRLQRANYASYAMYAGDTDTAIRESRTVLGTLLDPGGPAPSGAVDIFALLTLARASAAAGDLAGAEAAYAHLAAAGGVGASLASLGRADIAMLRGRFREAIATLDAGIAADREIGDSEAEASKQVALAESQLALGNTAAAVAAARRVSGLRRHESVLVPAALVLVEAGRTDEAHAIAETLRGMLQSQTAAYAGLIEGQIALKDGRLADAFDRFRDAQSRYDSWLGHYLLGRAHLEAQQTVEAIGEFQRCLDRKGEATDVFIDDKSTLHDLPPVYYWMGVANQQIGGTEAARTNLQRYVDLRAGADPPDPLAADAQRRLAELHP
jgi:tetratricopeptide (TPR) repeat protein